MERSPSTDPGTSRSCCGPSRGSTVPYHGSMEYHHASRDAGGHQPQTFPVDECDAGSVGWRSVVGRSKTPTVAPTGHTPTGPHVSAMLYQSATSTTAAWGWHPAWLTVLGRWLALLASRGLESVISIFHTCAAASNSSHASRSTPLS
jgi:hypothetical protein